MRQISKLFYIILTDYLTENAPVRKNLGIHTSEITVNFTGVNQAL